MTIGEKLLLYRAKYNLTQKQMAKLLNVHSNMIHRYEKENVTPRKVKVIQIEKKLKELEMNKNEND